MSWVVPLELGVGLAVGDLGGVDLDDRGLAIGAERSVDIVAGERLGIIGHRDVLVGELAMDE